jgi:hypothetical protein
VKRQHIHTTNSARRANSLLAFLLLFLYVAGYLQPEALHHLSHRDDAEVQHTAITEKDPCHRALYHAAVADGCDHSAHYTTQKKCAACHLVFHSAHLVSAPDDATTTDTVVLHTVAEATFPCAGEIDFSSSRAPPVA